MELRKIIIGSRLLVLVLRSPSSREIHVMHLQLPLTVGAEAESIMRRCLVISRREKLMAKLTLSMSWKVDLCSSSCSLSASPRPESPLRKVNRLNHLPLSASLPSPSNLPPLTAKPNSWRGSGSVAPLTGVVLEAMVKHLLRHWAQRTE